MTIRECLRNNPVIVFFYWLPIKFFLFIARFFPLQNKIVFNSFNGKGFCDDPKYIYLELKRRCIKTKYIWLVNDLNTEMPDDITKVLYKSWKQEYHFLTSKIWIDNAKSTPKPAKRKGQFYLQTWHGPFSNKKIEKDAENTLPQDYIQISKKDSAITDLMYANSNFRIKQFQNAFWYNGPVIKADAPQLSALVNSSSDTKHKIYKKLNIDENLGVVLYAPTFRSEVSIEPYIWDYKKILNALELRFQKSFVMLIRMHPNVEQFNFKFDDRLLNVTSYPDVYEIMTICDVLISDFSGVAFDMGFVKRPVFLFAKDWQKYLKNDRETYFKQTEIPFSFSKNEIELVENIANFDYLHYKNELDSFYNMIGMDDSGTGATKIASILVEKLKL